MQKFHNIEFGDDLLDMTLKKETKEKCILAFMKIKTFYASGQYRLSKKATHRMREKLDIIYLIRN